jgi:DNA-binding response OmpR family regulator
MPVRALAAGADAPLLRPDDVAALVNRIRVRVATAAGAAAPFPGVLIRGEGREHQVRVAAADRRVLAVRDALATEVAAWLAVHGVFWDSCGTLAVKLEPDRA